MPLQREQRQEAELLGPHEVVVGDTEVVQAATQVVIHLHGSLATPSLAPLRPHVHMAPSLRHPWLRCVRTREAGRMATGDLTALAARRAELRDKYIVSERERPQSNGGGVHHLALICADPERTIRFYQDILGFPLVELFENRDYEGSSHFFFDIGNRNLLGFFDFPGLGLEPVPEGLGGVQHFAISVTPEAFKAAKARLDDAGVKYLGPDMGVKESIYFKDPDNIQVELIRQPLMEVPESAPQNN